MFFFKQSPNLIISFQCQLQIFPIHKYTATQSLKYYSKVYSDCVKIHYSLKPWFQSIPVSKQILQFCQAQLQLQLLLSWELKNLDYSSIPHPCNKHPPNHKSSEYQPSGAGGTCSPPAIPNRPLNPKWLTGSGKKYLRLFDPPINFC